MPPNSGNASPRKIDDPRVRTLLSGVVLVVMAWLVYRPDRLRPFHILDFSEFIPILLREDGFMSGTRNVIEYYASQGRFNVIPYVLLGLKWNAFHWWTPGWQVARAVLMVALFVLTFVFLRRVGASRFGGIAGASVYLWSPSATDGWVRMTIAEPLGAAIILALSIRAVRYQQNDNWKREIGIMALGAAMLIWTKELMAPALVLPVGLALTARPDGSFAFPTVTRRNVSLVVCSITATLLALVPIAVLYLRAEEAAYASMYGRGMQTLSGIIAIWITMLVPFVLIATPANAIWALAVVGFALLIAIGWRTQFRQSNTSTRARWLLCFAVFVPLIGLLAYLPNPWYAGFYTLPYLFGPALLTGMAVSWLAESGPRGASFAAACWLAMIAYASTSAATHAARTDAVQRRDDRVITFVADSVKPDTVQFATMRRPPYDWLGLGAAMKRMSSARGTPWPVTLNGSCTDARQNFRAHGRWVTVNLDSSCRFELDRLKVISVPYCRIDLRQFRVVTDSAHADIVLPDANHRSR